MMSKKYYTPEIEEFHVGLEYKVGPFELMCTSVNTDTVSGSTYKVPIKDRVNHTFSNRLATVKHLDREDIESLDWEFKLNGFSEDGESTFDKFQRGDKFLLCEDNNYVIIWMENLNSVIYFRGYIKNKSELKRILKQIGV